MSPLEPDFDDELLSEAEAFEAELRQNRDGDEGFAHRHRDLAAVLQLLHDVFSTPGTEVSGTTRERLSDVAIPRQIGRFQIVSLLGCGGFAIVYRAYDEVLQRDVAIKLIPRRGSDVETEADKRLGEARAVARLSHPNIVPLFEIHREGDAFCLVSEFCDGPTLGGWLLEHPGPTDPRMAAEIVRSLAEGVAHAHGRGLAHRDIKPGNVLLAPTSEREPRLPFVPRLTDFGLARDLEHIAADDESTQLVGTWEYMAPEQMRGEESACCCACDIHALGAVLYRLLTGRQPFTAANRLELMREICTQPPRGVRQLVPHVPRDLEAICLKCLTKDPAARYGTANALAEDLARWEQGRRVRARAPNAMERVARTVRRAPVQSALIATILLLATTAAILLHRDNRRLAEREVELESALADVLASEVRAVTAEADARVAAHDAESQRQLAESHLQAAVATAYDADLASGFEALRQSGFAEVERITTAITRYAQGTVPIGCDVRLLQALNRELWLPLTPHSTRVSEVVVLPTLDCAWTAGTDGMIRRHSLTRGMVEDEIRLGASKAIWALATTADGAWIAAGYVDHSVHPNSNREHVVALLPQGAGGTQREIPGLPTTVESLAFLPDDRLAVGCRYEPLQIRSCANDATRLDLPSTRRNEEMVVAPDGETVIAYSAHRKLARYGARDGRLLDEVELAFTVSHLAGSPDGRWLAVSLTGPPYLLLFDTLNLAAPPRQFDHVFGEPACLAFSPTGRRLAVGLSNGGVVVWDMDAAKGSESEISFRAVPHNAEVTALAFSDEAHVVSGAADGALAMFGLHSAAPDLLEGSGIVSRSACLTSDGRTILIGGHDGRLLAMDVRTRQVDTVLPSPFPAGAALSEMVLSPDGHWLALAWEDRDVALMEYHSHKVIRRESKRRPGDSDLWQVRMAFDVTGGRLAIAHHFDGLSVWTCPPDSHVPRDAEGGVPTDWEGVSERRIATVCFQVETGKLVYGGQSEDIRCFDFTRQVEEVVATNASDITVLMSDPREGGLVSGYGNGLIRRFDKAGRLLALSTQPLRAGSALGSRAEVTTLVLVSEGKRLLSGNRDGEVSLWDAVTLRHLGFIRAGDGRGEVTDIGLDKTESRLLIHVDRTSVEDGSDLLLIEMPAVAPPTIESP
jgi:WD40 repeat protein